MKSVFSHRWMVGFALCGLLLPSLVWGAKPEAKTSAAKVTAEEVEMFAAMKAGDIVVKFIPKDALTGTMTIKNKTKKPLSIKLPEAFAGVPVAAQFGGGMGGMGGGMGGMGGGMGGMGGGMNQGIGGGMGGMGGGMGGMGGGMGGMGGGGMGGGVFNVAAGAEGKLKVNSVCLEHGKRDPNARIPYDVQPIEFLNSDPKVIELVKMVGKGELDQKSAQAAAWHMANGLSWEKLANKVGAKHLDGSKEAYFNEAQLTLAMKLSQVAEYRAKESAKNQPTSGKETSVSQTIGQ